MRTFVCSAALSALVLAAAAPTHPARSAQPNQRDSVAIVDRAHSAADLFVQRWRAYWEISESFRRFAARGRAPVSTCLSATTSTWQASGGIRVPVPTLGECAVLTNEFEQLMGPPGSGWLGFESQRSDLLHCHPDTPPRTLGFVIADRIIDSHVAAWPGSPRTWAVCPTWYLNGTATPWDEGDDIDAAIAGLWRPDVRDARRQLIGRLAQSAGQLPGDGWIAGQRVRFAVDQRDTTQAARAVADCRATAWWCSALAGYAFAARRDVSRADSAFGAMLALMPADVLCASTDLSILLDRESSAEYGRVPCADRARINDRIWWLADPLYMDPGNERRVEHYSRWVLVALRRGTEYSERWDMRPENGGNAVADMIVRYGWPSYSYWMGAAQDVVHFRDMGATGDQAHARFATAEYGQPRYHTLPTWSMVLAPTGAHEAEFVPMSGEHYFLALSDSAGWWPVEHVARRAGPLVQLWSQIGVFRRDSSALLAVAADLPARGFADAAGDTLRGAFVFSTGPGGAVTSAGAEAIVGQEVALLTPIASYPQVVSLELFGAHPTGVAARTRFGVEPPPSLSAMREGEIAIAPPVIVRPPDGADRPSANPDSALARMQGPAIADWSRVGLYWETYGVHAGDTVDVFIRLDRDTTPPSYVKRLGYRTDAGASATSAFTFSWREPDPTHATTTIGDRMPIQGRNITLDLSRVERGSYTLVVGVARPGGVAATAARDFQVR